MWSEGWTAQGMPPTSASRLQLAFFGSAVQTRRSLRMALRLRKRNGGVAVPLLLPLQNTYAR